MTSELVETPQGARCAYGAATVMMQSLLMFVIIICFYFLEDQGDLNRARGIKHCQETWLWNR